MNEFHYIAIEGVLGVGKTTFAKKLAADLNARLILENVDNNPFLELFYKDMKNHSLQTQLHFLLNRAKQQKEIKQPDLFQRKIVSDYIIDKDKIFAYATLSDDEIAIYEKIYAAVINEDEIVKPDIVVFLQASVDTLMERIKKRGRHFEKNISADYLDKISQAYNYFFSHFPRTIPLVIINTDEFDIFKNEEEYEKIKKFILNVKGGVHYYKPHKG
jgi:deoxyadenosine/deoxycytidine kinase